MNYDRAVTQTLTTGCCVSFCDLLSTIRNVHGHADEALIFNSVERLCWEKEGRLMLESKFPSLSEWQRYLSTQRMLNDLRTPNMPQYMYADRNRRIRALEDTMKATGLLM